MIVTLAAALLAQSVEITVYNQGFGLVKESRRLAVKAGRQTLAIEDVAALIDPTSVSFVPKEARFRVLEQNYQYDLVGVQAILNKSVGKRVRFIRTLGGVRDELEGVLLSAPSAIINSGEGSEATYDGLVIRTDNGRIILSPTGEIEVTSLPDGLISKPTLVWDLEAPTAGDVDVDLSYITQGMNWSADYVLTLSPGGKADLQGWVTLNNQSGATFVDAKLKLLAGDVNVAQPHSRNRGMAAPMEAMSMAVKDGFQEESLFEYHLYTLGRPATLRNRETKQLSLLEGHGFPYVKRLVIDSMMGYGTYYPQEGSIGVGDVKPLVQLEFTNDKKSDLGIALPAGRFRVYQRDASGSTQLLGEDRIGHTPREEKVRLGVGRAFDVVATRRRTGFTRLDKQAVRETFEIEIRNRKDTPETVTVLERKWGDWKITTKSQEFVKVDANTAEFTVRLAANEVKTLSYTVETRW